MKKEDAAEVPENLVGRRRLLKVLALGGGAVGLSAIPTRWARPEIGVGSLPVHAQGSGMCAIAADCDIRARSSCNSTLLLTTDTVLRGSVFVCLPTCTGAAVRVEHYAGQQR